MATVPGRQTQGVEAVSRALAILDAFKAGEPALGLSEIARRVNLHRSTVLRIARTMSSAGYLTQQSDGVWRLGVACAWAGSRYGLAADAAIIEPILRRVFRDTGESVSYYVREGWNRVCVARVDASSAPHTHVRIGEILPLNKGAAGGVLLAFSGESGEFYQRIRTAGIHSTLGKGNSHGGSIACPVLEFNRLIGCISISFFGPKDQVTKKTVARFVQVMREAAAQLSYELGVSHSKRAGKRPRTVRL